MSPRLSVRHVPVAVLAVLLAACPAEAPAPATVERLEVSPADVTIATGTTTAFEATAHWSDGRTEDVTKKAAWTSVDAAVVTFPAGARPGTARGAGVGSTQVSAAFEGKSAVGSIAVTAATLVSLAIDPPVATLVSATSMQLTATGTFSDGTTQELTADATWTTDAAAVATFSDETPGLLSALGAGATRVTATIVATTATAAVAVTAVALEELELSETAVTLAAGTTTRVIVTGLFADGSSQDVSSLVTWTSSAPEQIAVTTDGPDRGTIRALAVGTGDVSATWQGRTRAVAITVTDAELRSLSIDPPLLTLGRGATAGLTVTGHFSDATTQDLTAQAGFSSSDVDLATISNGTADRGVVTAVAPGAVTLTAALGAIEASIPLTITPATLVSLALSPALPTLAAGTHVQLLATGAYSDGTHLNLTSAVTWSSSAQAVAAISNAGATAGRLTGLGSGTATISAELDDVTAALDATVTAARLDAIELTPAAAVLPVGATLAFTATGRYSDATTQPLTSAVTWEAGDTDVAAISNAPATTGTLTGLASGATTVHATLDGVTGTTMVTVTDARLVALAASPATLSAPTGVATPLVLTGTFSDGTTIDVSSTASWSSSDPAVMAVSARGVATGLAPGTATVTGTVAAALGARAVMIDVTITAAELASIGVTPALSTVATGSTLQLDAQGVWTDGTTTALTSQVTWTTADDTKLAVAPTGLATALGAGIVRVTARMGELSGIVDVVVTPAHLVSLSITPPLPRLARGTFGQLVATGLFSDATTQDLSSAVTWTSAAPHVATVSNAEGSGGLLAGLAEGTSVVTAELTGVSGSTTVTVSNATLASLELTPAALSLPKGVGRAIVAIGHFSDGSTQEVTTVATWQSSDPAVVSVSTTSPDRGHVRALAVGTARVTAAIGEVTVGLDVTVTAAELVSLSVTPATGSLPKGTTRQLTATGTYTDSTTVDVTTQATWTSSAPEIVAVSTADGTRGLASGLGLGPSTITATLGTVGGQASLTGTAAALTSLDVAPAAPSRAKGLTVSFVATGHYTDNTTQDVTASATWTSSNTAVASISNEQATRGRALATGVGVATITAQIGAITRSTTFTVTAAELVGVRVTPASTQLPKGATRQLTATGVYTDTSTQPLTSQATWSTESTAVSVSNAAGSEGVIQGLALGTATVIASYEGHSGSAQVDVTEAIVASLSITAPGTTLAAGSHLDLVATGTYTDGTTAVRTAEVAWTTSAAARATVETGGATPGRVTGVSAGAVTITATEGLATFSVDLTITGAALVSIAVTPATVAVGATRQLVATGTLSDGSTQDVAGSASWTTSAPGVATISNADGSRGLATGVAAGTTQVTAAVGTVTSPAVAVTVAAAGDCTVVINEFQTGGSNANHEFVELFNPCAAAVDLTGWKLAYRSAAGVSDNAMGALLSGSLAAGGYFLAVSSSYATAFPTVVAQHTFSNAIGGGGGGFGLRNAALELVDSVGYGTATNAFVETAAAPAPASSKSAGRTPNGVDTDDNSADFTVADVPSPGAAN